MAAGACPLPDPVCTLVLERPPVYSSSAAELRSCDRDRLSGPQNLKCFLSGPFQKRLADLFR